MCIMEVRPGQHTSTMVQAELHNTQTVLSDLEMLRDVCTARKDQRCLTHIDRVENALTVAVNRLHKFYQEEVEAHESDPHGTLDSQVGEERYNHDRKLAAPFETRREVTEVERENWTQYAN